MEIIRHTNKSLQRILGRFVINGMEMKTKLAKNEILIFLLKYFSLNTK